jgi:hypothetical protein
MADSGALRARRARLHKAGDHSICRRCAGRAAAVVPLAGEPVRIDPGASLERLAARLEAAHESDPADAGIARELRATLLALAGSGDKADRELAEFVAEFSGA